MFTGLVETLGVVTRSESSDGLHQLDLTATLAGEPLKLGESIAVDGVCLTVCTIREGGMTFDVVQETLNCTHLGRVVPGDTLHLERALRVGDRLGGHWVQGHVDTEAEVIELRRNDGDVRLKIQLPASIARYVVYKGSLAVDGVSLTVARVNGESFVVALIPATLKHTKLGGYGPGTRVHLEVDLLARYLEGMHRVE